MDASTGEEARVRVIVKVKAGARKGLLRRLQAYGGTVRVGQEYTIIEGFSANLPKRLVRVPGQRQGRAVGVVRRAGAVGRRGHRGHGNTVPRRVFAARDPGAGGGRQHARLR